MNKRTSRIAGTVFLVILVILVRWYRDAAIDAAVGALDRLFASSKTPPGEQVPSCSLPRKVRALARSFDVNEATQHALALRSQGNSREAFCFLQAWLEARDLIGVSPERARPEACQVLNRQGDLLVDLQRFSAARRTYDRAYAVAKAHGRAGEMGTIANNIGLLASIGYHSIYRRPSVPYRPDLDAALTWFSRAVEHFRDAGDLDHMVMALNNAGMSATNLGRIRRAFSLYAQAAAVSRMQGDHAQARKALASQAYVLYSATVLAQTSGQDEVDGLQPASDLWEIQARHLLAQAVEEAHRTGTPAETVCDAFGRAASVCLAWIVG